MNTHDKILKATINCIKDSGIDAFSGRKICTDLGINVSSIKYHFGSKEKLLEQAIIDLSKMYLQFASEIFTSDMAIKEKLISYYLKLQEVIEEKPFIARHILSAKNELQVESHSDFAVTILDELHKNDIHIGEYTLRIKSLQVISALAYPAELGLFSNFTKRQKRDYVKGLVQDLLLKG